MYHYEITVNKQEDKKSKDLKGLLNIIVYDKQGKLAIGCNAYGRCSHGPETGYRSSHLTGTRFNKIFPNTYLVFQKDKVEITLIYNDRKIPIVRNSLMKKDYYFAMAEFIINLKANNHFNFENCIEEFLKTYAKYHKHRKELM